MPSREAAEVARAGSTLRRALHAPRRLRREVRLGLERLQDARRPVPPRDEYLAAALAADRELADVIGALRSRTFFVTPERARGVAAALERARPGWLDATVAGADRLLAREVRLLGADEVQLPRDGGVPWHADPFHDFAWSPKTYYKQIAVPYDRADIKVPWELSRCQHLPTLGMAYAATGDERYAREIVAQIGDWISANPPRHGVNWACTMDVAIRAVNWLWAFQLVADAGCVDDEFLLTLLASLVAHARHIAANIERYEHGVTTNHTVADYTGLFYLGVALPELAEAGAWRQEGRDGLEECLRAQVLPDGADFENSTSYHRLVFEMFLGAYLLGRRADVGFSSEYAATLEGMADFVLHYTRPDGLAPLLGDSDDGRLHILSDYFGWDPQDHRHVLGPAAALFGREDLAAAAAGAAGALEETAWLMGEEAAARVAATGGGGAPLASRAFEASGRYVMRHGGHHAVICADPVGSAGLGNHKHNDILGYELAVDGVAVVVDPGSYLYTSDVAWRDRFRSTAAHSTVVVDGAEQNEPTGAFGMRSDASVEVKQWRSEAERDVFSALHTGYERLASPVVHERTIVLHKHPFAWLVVDTLRGAGDHVALSHVHLAPEGELLEPDGRGAAERAAGALAALMADAAPDVAAPGPGPDAVRYRRDGVTVLITPFGAGPFSVVEGWTAPRYGQRVAAPVLRLGGTLALPATFGYLVLTEGEGTWGG